MTHRNFGFSHTHPDDVDIVERWGLPLLVLLAGILVIGVALLVAHV